MSFAKCRKYGDKGNLSPGSIVCHLCFEYLKVGGKTQLHYKHAWPSLAYSWLTDPRLKPYGEKLLQLWDSTIKLQFIKVDMDSDFRSKLYTPGLLNDITLRRKFFQQDIEKATAARITSAVNRECLASVRCPAGCYCFIEDKYDLIPFHHVLNQQISNFTSFGADKDNIRGARSNWLDTKKFTFWSIKPATIMDPEKGLCIVACKDHSNLGHDFIHVPENPIQCDYENAQFDPLATISGSTNFVRGGKNSQYNTSFGVVNQKVNSVGVSVFRVCLKGNTNIIFTEFQKAIAKLVYENRPELRHHLDSGKNEYFPANNLSSYVSDFVNYCGGIFPYPHPSNEDVKKALKSATYMPFADELHLARTMTDTRNTINKKKDLRIIILIYLKWEIT